MNSNFPHRSRFAGIRWLLAPVFGSVLLLGCLMPLLRTSAATPASGTIGPSGPAVTWVGDVTGSGGTLGEGNCIDSGPGKNCDSFALTLSGTESDWTGKLVQVRVARSLGTHAYALSIPTGDLSGPVAAS